MDIDVSARKAPGLAGPETGFLGRVLSCRGSEARIGLTELPSLGAKRATIGKFVAISSGESRLVGMISEVSAAEAVAGEPGAYRAVARIDLLGEISADRGPRMRFNRGVRNYPAIGDAASVISREDLNLIYSPSGYRSIAVGELNQDASIAARIDVDDMLTKHFAVLGSTGVGKSSGVAVIVGEVMKVRPDVRVLLLDLHNEYAKSFGDDAAIIGAHNLRLPFWLLNFEEFTDVVYGGKPAVPEEVEILAELIPMAKASYQIFKNGHDRNGLITRKGPKSGGFSADTPAPYLIQDLLGLIDERMGKLENRSTRMVHHRLMMRIEGIKNDPRFAFMFENANVGGDTMTAVLNQLFRIETEGCGVTVLTLASLPGEVLDAIVCVTARLAFEFGLWSDGGIPLLLVCEEAHRYASADHAVGFAPARRALSRIAKEGRKYGVHLGLVTQRPAELDPTIISQCSTLFFMRMANDQDQHILRSAVSDAAENLLSFIPSLGTGEVVGIGEGMPVPTRFSFRTLPRDMLPSSEPQVSDDGRTPERGELLKRAVERWRRATTSQYSLQTEGPSVEPQPEELEPERKSALNLGLQALAAERAATRLLDPERYSILKR